MGHQAATPWDTRLHPCMPTAAWKVHSPPCDAAWEGHQQQRQAKQKASKVMQLFHGTGKDAARAPRPLHPQAKGLAS